MMAGAIDIICAITILSLQGHSFYGNLQVLRPSDNKTYFLTLDRIALEDAEAECIALGGKYHIFKTNAEFDSFGEELSRDEFETTVLWITHSQVKTGSVIHYYWQDEEIDSSMWYPNTTEPNLSAHRLCAGTEFCVAARRRYRSVPGTPDTATPRLIDTCCDAIFYVICEDVNECQCKNTPECLGIPYKCEYNIAEPVLNDSVQCFNDAGTHHCVLYSPTLTPFAFNVSAGGDIDLTCAYHLQSESPIIFVRLFKDGIWYTDGPNVTDLNRSTLRIGNFSYADEGAYQCSIVIETEIGDFLEAGKSNFAQFQVIPPLKPNLDLASGLPLVPLGGSVTLTCIASNPQIVSEYRWMLNGGLVATENDPNYDITDFSIDDAGLYSCIVSVVNVSSEESDSRELRLNISTPVLIANATSCQEGDALSLTCSNFDDVDGKLVFFIMDGTVIYEAVASGVDNISLILYNFDFDMQGSYTCTVRIRNEESNPSNVLYLMVKPLLTASLTRVQPGLDTVLNCQMSATVEATCVWYKDGVERPPPTTLASNSTGGTIIDSITKIISNFGPFQEGNYACKIISGNKASFQSDGLYLTTATPDPPVLTVTREGASVNLTCHSTVPNSTIYSWKKDGALLGYNEPILVIPFFNSSMEEQYSCAVDIYGLSSNDSNTINLDVEVNIESSSLIVSQGSNVKLTCSASLIDAQSYTWLKDGQIFRVVNDDTITLMHFQKQMEGNYSCQVQRMSDNEWIQSSSIELKYILYDYFCPCPCNGSTQDPITEEQLQEISSDIEKNLTVNRETLSSYIRKKTSAEDKRVSSSSIGWFAIVFISIVFLSLVMSDIISVVSWALAALKSIIGKNASKEVTAEKGEQTGFD